MSRLTEQTFWDHAYARADRSTFDPSDPAELNDARRWRSHAESGAVGRDLAHLGDKPGQRVIEVGSAPGRNLVRLHRRFGLDPWGVEYTATGARLNRGRFEAIGVDPAQVIEEDALSDAFLSRWGGQFDVVFSMGFIEHFDDPGPVVRRHIELCRPGGLVVSRCPTCVGSTSR